MEIEGPETCFPGILDLPPPTTVRCDEVEICIASKVVPGIGDYNLNALTGTYGLCTQSLLEVANLTVDENTPSGFSTPSAKRFRDALNTKIPVTPSRRLRLASTPLTPRTPRSSISSKTQQRSSTYAEAKALFSQSAGSLKVVGRDQERAQISKFISEAVAAKKGGCTYISG